MNNIYKRGDDAVGGEVVWLIYLSMIGKKLRVRSEVAELGYISPWKLTQETGRNNDLELFLSKNAHHD